MKTTAFDLSDRQEFYGAANALAALNTYIEFAELADRDGQYDREHVTACLLRDLRKLCIERNVDFAKVLAAALA